MKSGRIAFACAMLALAAMGLQPAVAQPVAGAYIFDILKKKPGMLKPWSAIVPGAYAGQRWIKGLEGTSGPVDRVTFSGKPFVLGSVCWPHNCGGNFVAFLIAEDGSEAYGLLRSSDLGAKDVPFGKLDAEKRKTLAAYLDR